MRLFAKLNLPNTQVFAVLSFPKIHQKSKPFKNQALYGQTLFRQKVDFYDLSRNQELNYAYIFISHYDSLIISM